MAVLFRIFLISLLIYLVIRSFRTDTRGEGKVTITRNKDKSKEGISKDIGEFVDYEEIKD